MTNEGGKTCPVCTEEMDLTDLQLKPCKCGYEVCVWCWNHIMDMAEKDGSEGRCPACRTPYDKEKIVNMAASVDISSERKPKSQKVKSKTYDGRKHLSNVRVVQRHLVYTMGIPANLADEDVLQRREFFGQYGKVLKASLTRTSGGAIQFSTNNTCSVYITFQREEEAIRCIQSVHGYVLQGQPLRACFGTTKYCHAWLRNMPCSNPDCVYLHDVGNQEDSFTKDEIVSAYTRSRVQQITGATNNLERRTSGDVLPPPLDESCFSGTVPSKPISRSPSENPPSQLKSSPPNSSSGRSISLPAAASWGLRVSNGHTPTSNPATVNDSLKSKPDSNGSVGFPSLVASTNPVSMVQSDVGKKSWVIKEGRAVPLGRESGPSEYSKQYTVVDSQQTVPVTVGDMENTALNTVPSYLGAYGDDNCIQDFPNVTSSVEIDQQSWAYPEKDDNIAVDGKVQSVGSGLSSLCIDNFHSEEGLQQSYPEHGGEQLTPLPPRDVVKSDGVYVSRESANWGSEPHAQVLRDSFGALEDDFIVSGAHNSNFSEACHPLHIPHRSSPINISSSSNGHSWSYDHTSSRSDQVTGHPLSVHTKADEVGLPFTSSDSVFSNGFLENNVGTSSGLEKIFEQANIFSSVENGGYSGKAGNNSVDFPRNTVDMGENNIISNILSMDFDSWDEPLASPQNLAKLLNETDKNLGSLKIRSSRKEQNSNQSRFSFARQVDSADQGTSFDLARSFGNTMNMNPAPHVYQDRQDMHFDEISNGLSCKFLEESDSLYGGNLSTFNRFSGSRTPVAAPPGFSAPSKVPPPGFSAQERMEKAFEPTTANHYLGSTPLLRNHYHVQPTNEAASMGDMELFDPAILAVGTGRPANGLNDYSLDMRSAPAYQLGASDNDPRFQLLRQQFLPPQQNLRYMDHVSDRFSPLTDAYNTQSRYLDQSQYAQLSSVQPRIESTSHGWNNWNETQSSNNLGMAELFKNERFGYGQYYPEYDNRTSRMSKQNDLYNKAYGM